MEKDLEGEKFWKEIINGEFEILICSIHRGDSGNFTSLLCKVSEDRWESISLTCQHLQWLFTKQYDRLIQEVKNFLADNDFTPEDCFEKKELEYVIQWTLCGIRNDEFIITNYDNYAYSDLLA